MTRAWMLAFAGLLLACGAKTGLRVPDVEVSTDAVAEEVADVPEVPDLPDTCVAPAQPLVRLVAEVIFVIDRSGSMAERTRLGLTRWQALTAALERVLPAVDAELWTGLVQFPTMPAGTTVACGIPPTLDEAPRPFNATRVLARLRASTPVGGTPTFDAIQSAARYYATNPQLGRTRGRYLVLATDGGPNCNPSLAASSCRCTNPRGCTGSRGVYSCLDDQRTAELLALTQGAGVPTFVIGATGQEELYLQSTLDALALAGGRPRASRPRYYPAEDVDEFATAFRSITTALVRCRYVTNPIDTPDRVTVLANGRPLPRDRTRTDGWDWENTAAGELVLYGPTCEATANARANLSARIECAD